MFGFLFWFAVTMAACVAIGLVVVVLTYAVDFTVWALEKIGQGLDWLVGLTIP